MEGGIWILLVLMAVVLFGVPGAALWQRSKTRIDSASPIGSANRDNPKVRVIRRVLDVVARSIISNLEHTRMSYHPGDPDDVMTLIMDIEQFRHLRKHRGMWQHQGIFAEREIERRWARRPPAIREWEGIEFVVPIAIRAAFDEGPWLRTVRLWIGDTENDVLTVCRVSVEARKGQARRDWRYDKRAKGYLAPVTPHGDFPPTLSATGLAEDPYDFEQQVAQMLRNRGLVVEVTGGSGDEGIDILAHDDTPVTGGTYLVQCKRYSPDHKVGVSEVRELYGTMQEKHAAKGVLVTSSAFTTGALRFAEDKSIELIDGPHLSALIANQSKPVPVTDTPVPDVYLKADLDFSEPSDMKPSNEPSDLTELLLAVQEGDLMALTRAINGDVDIDAANEDGVTALQLAITGGNLTILEAVIASGANVNARYGILTPLIFAIEDGRTDVVSILLNHGADANLPGGNGFSPLHLAVARAQHTIVLAAHQPRSRCECSLLRRAYPACGFHLANDTGQSQ